MANFGRGFLLEDFLTPPPFQCLYCSYGHSYKVAFCAPFPMCDVCVERMHIAHIHVCDEGFLSYVHLKKVI